MQHYHAIPNPSIEQHLCGTKNLPECISGENHITVCTQTKITYLLNKEIILLLESGMSQEFVFFLAPQKST